MELTTSLSLPQDQPWHTHFNSTDQTLEVYFTDEIRGDDIENCLGSVQAAIRHIPANTILINDDKVKNDPLSLDWKIIEASWESFCGNGGEKIIVIHQAGLPAYLQKTYTQAIEDYGIPVDLEFKTSDYKAIDE